MVCKFHALAASFRTALALELALQNLAAENIKRIKPAHKFRIEQIR